MTKDSISQLIDAGYVDCELYRPFGVSGNGTTCFEPHLDCVSASRIAGPGLQVLMQGVAFGAQTTCTAPGKSLHPVPFCLCFSVSSLPSDTAAFMSPSSKLFPAEIGKNFPTFVDWPYTDVRERPVRSSLSQLFL